MVISEIGVKIICALCNIVIVLVNQNVRSKAVSWVGERSVLDIYVPLI